jgi:hypothetical protein
VRVAETFGIPAVASGGFDSVTAKYSLSEFLGVIPGVEVLHIGDHDKEGKDIFQSLSEDVRKLCADYGWSVPEFTRLAATPEQITAFGLADDPDNPGKVQAEALPHDVVGRDRPVGDRRSPRRSSVAAGAGGGGARQGGVARQVRRYLNAWLLRRIS